MSHRVLVAIASLIFPAIGWVWAEESGSTDAEAMARTYLQASGQVSPKLKEFLKEGMKELQPQESEELWDALFVDVDELLTALYPIYVEYLSPDDMMAAIDFYRTPAGMRIAEQQLIVAHKTSAATKAWMQETLSRNLDRLAEGDIDTPLLNKKRLRDTISDLREVGTALISWLENQAQNPGDELSVDRLEMAWSLNHEKSGSVLTFSAVSYDSIVKILVPAYLKAVPERDAWGNPYHYSVNENILAFPKVSIRSSGRDGVFEDGDYIVGAYDSEDYDRDVVWADGYFVRWPERKQ